MHQVNYRLLVGIDLGQWLHRACVIDANAEFVGERGFAHSAEGLSETVDWLLKIAKQKADSLAVAIEKPHGAVVETLLESGIAVFSINPKQTDRFRDRHSMSGAKDDGRDAFVLADALRTDGHRFQRLKLPPPEIIAMRGLLITLPSALRSETFLYDVGHTSSPSLQKTRHSIPFSASSSSSSSMTTKTNLFPQSLFRSLSKSTVSDG